MNEPAQVGLFYRRFAGLDAAEPPFAKPYLKSANEIEQFLEGIDDEDYDPVAAR